MFLNGYEVYGKGVKYPEVYIPVLPGRIWYHKSFRFEFFAKIIFRESRHGLYCFMSMSLFRFNYAFRRLIKVHAEDTLWTGTPVDYTNPDAPEALAEVRKLVDDGKYAEATAAAVKLSGKPSDVILLNPS